MNTTDGNASAKPSTTTAPPGSPASWRRSIDDHDAIDTLFAMLIVKDSGFRPSQSTVWPTVQQSQAVIARAKAQS